MYSHCPRGDWWIERVGPRMGLRTPWHCEYEWVVDIDPMEDIVQWDEAGDDTAESVDEVRGRSQRTVTLRSGCLATRSVRLTTARPSPMGN
jgi:hypothetical protein